MHPDLKPGIRSRFEYIVSVERRCGAFIAGVELISEGVHERAVIDAARFMRKVTDKAHGR